MNSWLLRWPCPDSEPDVVLHSSLNKLLIKEQRVFSVQTVVPPSDLVTPAKYLQD